MSTSETDEYRIGICPCGKGSIIKTVVTQDNPWSGADVSYNIDCGQCRADWELSRSGDRLTLRSSVLPSQQAGEVLMEARRDLSAYLRDLAAKHFGTQGLRTKKAEHEYLAGLGMVGGSYRSYLQDRKSSPMHCVAHFDRNHTFVAMLVNTYGDKQSYGDLCKVVEVAEAAYRSAETRIVRRGVKS